MVAVNKEKNVNHVVNTVQNVLNQINVQHVRQVIQYSKENVLNHVQQLTLMMKEYVIHVLIIVIFVQIIINYILKKPEKKD